MKLALRILFYIFILAYSLYNELLFSLSISSEFGIYKFFFAVTVGIFLTLSGSLTKNKKINFTIQSVFTVGTSLLYITQLVYYSIFSTPYCITSLMGLPNALEFFFIALNTLDKYVIAYILMVLQLVVFFTLYRKRFFEEDFNLKKLIAISSAFILSLAVSILLPLTFTQGLNSPKYLLINEFVPLSSVRTFGVPACMFLDIKYTFLEAEEFEGDTPVSIIVESPSPTSNSETEPMPEYEPEEELIVYDDNVMDIDFNLEETDSIYLAMNEFFSKRTPTSQNEYTGIFEGKNLIMIVAESYSPYFIDPELTPTLYRMQSEGINFTNFYTPVWGVSTSDGEYVATTGLLPKSGVWSYTDVADNYMPFAFGNQFNALGYSSYAFHNHDYTYYNRDISYPAMGYEYYAKWNGLEVTDQWPESDLELIEVSTDFYIEQDKFHIYYLTVSGHMEYNFYGHLMAIKNKDLVSHLPYSDPVNAYIAANMEVELALEELVERLEAAGQLENTVIALSSDHYPYGLTVEEYAELRGVESIDLVFELYENGFFIWNSELETPVEVDKLASSLDIVPTLSNLFNLEYDSRLLIGQDILSDSEPLVMFVDKSFITEEYKFNSNTGEVTVFDGASVTEEEVNDMSAYIAQLFSMSASILDHDYYSYLFQ